MPAGGNAGGRAAGGGGQAVSASTDRITALAQRIRSGDVSAAQLDQTYLNLKRDLRDTRGLPRNSSTTAELNRITNKIEQYDMVYAQLGRSTPRLSILEKSSIPKQADARSARERAMDINASGARRVNPKKGYQWNR